MPSALGLASASLLFYALYSPQSGPIAQLLTALGIGDGTVSFLGTPDRRSVVDGGADRLAVRRLLHAAAPGRPAGHLQRRLRGGRCRRGQPVADLPSTSRCHCCSPSLALCTILCVTGSLLAFDQFYILTKGGPDNSTITVVQLVYNVAFGGRNDLGRGGRAVAHRARRAARHQRRCSSARCAARRTEPWPRRRASWSPYPSQHVLTGGLAVIFLFPLVWAAVASVAPQPGTAQVDGWGLGNYGTSRRLPGRSGPVPAQLTFCLGHDGDLHARSSPCSAGTPSPCSASRARTCCSWLTLAILMVPYATLLIPLYVLLNGIGLQNSLVGLALVLTMFQLPFATFMMRISFEAVPRELAESALVDGCGTFTALLRVLLPAVKPGLITVGLFAFLAAWNDFIAPLILITDSDKVPLPLAVANMRGQVMGVVDYGATEAGVVVLALPCVVLFLLLQRHYVRGFMSGALKG